MTGLTQVTELRERTKVFVGYLLALALPGREDRGALAALRSGLGKAPGQAAPMHKHVAPWLGDRERDSDRWFYVVGSLYAWHPMHEPGVSLGHAFRSLASEEGASDSTEGRFVALLSSHPEDLHDHLRHAIGLLRSHEIGLDWFRLLDDLIHWSLPDRAVQTHWAREFYRQERHGATQAAPQEED